jgi:hypothetical protein
MGLFVVILLMDIIVLVNIVQSTMLVGEKVLWALIVVLLPVVGMLLYFAVHQEA